MYGFVNVVTPGGNASLSVCVTILKHKPPDIDPTWRILILVSTATGQSNINL